MKVIRPKEIVEVLLFVADVIDSKKDYLTELDSAIGDGDLGVSMTLGFGAIRDELIGGEGESIHGMLRQCGFAFSNHAPSTIGALYATAFLQAASAIKDEESIDVSDIDKMFEAAIAGIKKRGKVKLGEKTIIDALNPAYEALRSGSGNLSNLTKLFDQCATAAEKGMEATKQLKSTRGRSRWLQDRSIGHIDPGAATVAIILRAVADWCKKADEQ